MTTYTDMWSRAKELSHDELEDWINVMSPAKGIWVDFRGVHAIDIDVIECLEYLLGEMNEQRHGRTMY